MFAGENVVVIILISRARSLKYYYFVDSRLDFSSEKDFMIGRCLIMGIVSFPCFFKAFSHRNLASH